MGAPNDPDEFYRIICDGVAVYLQKTIRCRERVVIRLAGFWVFKHLVMDGWVSGLLAVSG